VKEKRKKKKQNGSEHYVSCNFEQDMAWERSKEKFHGIADSKERKEERKMRIWAL
jgi:hypothetical protein